MTGGISAAVLRQFRTLYEAGTVAGMTDGQLLERFFAGRGEEAEVAFAAILARHGSMVLGVCRRALRDPNDADDAFQATFLILVRKGRSVRVEDSLGRWLYGVSRKVAARAREQSLRRRGVGLAEAANLPGPGGEAERRDLRALLDDELAALAEPFRSAVVLCDLGGLSLEEAARDLRCPVGTIKSRLARGRERLRIRLSRQGLAPSAAIFAAEGSAPAALVGATARGVSRFAASGTIEAGMVPASALALAEGMLKAMTLIKLKFAAAVLTCGLAATGAGVLAQQGPADPARPTAGPKPAVEPRPVDRGSAIARKLEGPITVDFVDQPLGEAISTLRKYTGVNMVLDPRALNDLGLSRDSKVTLKLRQVKLRLALKWLTRPLGLTYKVEDDVLLITTPARPFDLELGDPGEDLTILKKRLARAQLLAAGQDDPALVRALRAVAFAENSIAEANKSLARVSAAASEAVQIDAGLDDSMPGPPAVPARPNPPARESSKVSMPDYVVEPPDIIVVEVIQALPGRPISGERLIRPDGKISLGFYGEVYVAGLTVREAKAKVVQHLRQFVEDDVLGLTEADRESGKIKAIAPGDTTKVFVDVARYNSKVYYVQGEVGSPGRLPITGNETVLDAINYAGGVLPSAGVPNIRLVRPAPAGATTGEQVFEVDLGAIMNRGDASTNYQLFPGDRLVVSRDPKLGPVKVEPPAPAGDQEARLREVERKIDLILKKLEVPAGR